MGGRRRNGLVFPATLPVVPSVHSLASALPRQRVAQSELRAVASAMMRGGAVTMFDNARIEARALAMPLSWYASPRGFKDRNDAYARIGQELCVQAASQALAAAGLEGKDLAGIVFVSTTGIATPSLDARLAQQLECRPDVVRLPLWGLGCAGGVAGINRAADLARARPKGHFLVVCLELCTLSFPSPGAGDQRIGKKAMAAASLFGDGCGALLVSGDEAGPVSEGLRHVRGASHLFPETEHLMGWDVRDDHMDVVLSPQIPAVVRTEMRGLVDGFLAGGRVDRWALHPGGARVVDAYREVLELDDAALAATNETLAAHGNMSSPTVLFVLRRLLQKEKPEKGETFLMAALGPGFASELCLLEA